LTVTHVGKVQDNDNINDTIMAGIRAAQVIVADVTYQRNGVYFEGGFAMGLGRHVVWMCREDDLKNVHFDTRQYRHIVWTDHQDLRTKLTARLRANVAIPAR
jgi:nucleoside 2-deoxyribosyltransferase